MADFGAGFRFMHATNTNTIIMTNNDSALESGIGGTLYNNDAM